MLEHAHAVPQSEVAPGGFLVQQWLDFDGAGDHRVELIDGALVVNPAPGFVHQRVVVRLLLVLTQPMRDVGITLEVTGGGVTRPGTPPSQGLIPDLMAVQAALDVGSRRVLDGCGRRPSGGGALAVVPQA